MALVAAGTFAWWLFSFTGAISHTDAGIVGSGPLRDETQVQLAAGERYLVIYEARYDGPRRKKRASGRFESVITAQNVKVTAPNGQAAGVGVPKDATYLCITELCREPIAEFTATEAGTYQVTTAASREDVRHSAQRIIVAVAAEQEKSRTDTGGLATTVLVAAIGSAVAALVLAALAIVRGLRGRRTAS
ncbi:hypothetical protein GCM10027290_68380 [Micromonospora sonneratiae]